MKQYTLLYSILSLLLSLVGGQVMAQTETLSESAKTLTGSDNCTITLTGSASYSSNRIKMSKGTSAGFTITGKDKKITRVVMEWRNGTAPDNANFSASIGAYAGSVWTSEGVDAVTFTNDGTAEVSVTALTITYSSSSTGGGSDPTSPSSSVTIIRPIENLTQADAVSGNVALNSAVAQMMIATSGSTYYYNSADIRNISVDETSGKVMVTTTNGTDSFHASARNITFTKPVNISNIEGKVTINEAKGWQESAYITWKPFMSDGLSATTYHVYVKGGDYADYTKLDYQLVRDYDTYLRADALGLKAGNYTLKVVPVFSGQEAETAANEVSNLIVTNYLRAGFAFMNRMEGVGAYNGDGSLKTNARVIYVTAETAKTVTCDVVTSKKGTSTTFTGIQAILGAFEKGYETRPLAVRIIGLVGASDIDAMSSNEGLQIKGKNSSTDMNITIEGVGQDATIKGFGFLLRNACSIEMRNFGNMLCLDDGVSIDTNNKHIWIHNLDLFYGSTGGDSDQAKGDGMVDIKGNSQYVTVSSNHFWDSGKSSLCGMKSESGPNWISYDHNWFDHSDSRHPRIRTMSVHIWNNYFDGNSKYGVGVTTGSNAFVEANYFRNCKFPMLTSLQGNDVYAGTGNYKPNDYGTFSGEAGGSIKSYGNTIVDTNNTTSYWAYNAANLLTKGRMVTAGSLGIDTTVHFDAFEASSRDEQVPSTVTSFNGSYAYSNFDTDTSLMYTYTADAVINVPSIVMGEYGAGRMGHGDFTWNFDNSTEDTNAEVIPALKNALQNYQSSLKGICAE